MNDGFGLMCKEWLMLIPPVCVLRLGYIYTLYIYDNM